MNHYLVGIMLVWRGERERARRCPLISGLELVVLALLVVKGFA